MPRRYQANWVQGTPTTEEIVHAFVATMRNSKLTLDEPTMQQAMESEDWPEWLAAIHRELESLKAMDVYEDVDALPSVKKAIGSKWVLLIKRDENDPGSRLQPYLRTGC